MIRIRTRTGEIYEGPDYKFKEGDKVIEYHDGFKKTTFEKHNVESIQKTNVLGRILIYMAFVGIFVGIIVDFSGSAINFY